MESRRYSVVQRALHWSIALMVLWTLPTGIILGVFEFNGMTETFGKDLTNFVYQYHKTFGVLILGAMVLRSIARAFYEKPSCASLLTPFEQKASAVLHWSLYALLFLQPVLGWAATGAGGFPIEFFQWTLPQIVSKDSGLSKTLYELHRLLGWMLVLAIGAHIVAAMRHWLIKKDEVMRRMSLF